MITQLALSTNYTHLYGFIVYEAPHRQLSEIYLGRCQAAQTNGSLTREHIKYQSGNRWTAKFFRIMAKMCYLFVEKCPLTRASSIRAEAFTR